MPRIVTAQELADKIVSKVRTPAIPYVLGGRSDKGTDCINLIGWCMDELGGCPVSRGSNKAWREDMAWTGTLAEAVAQGKLVPGALLYIDYGDGAMDHAGIYVGDGYGLTTPDGKRGDVVHASSSRKGVYPSTLKNGWTHVAWLKGVEYGGFAGTGGSDNDVGDWGNRDNANDIGQPTAKTEPRPGQAKVVTRDGDGLNLRKQPDKKAAGIKLMPDDTIVDVIQVWGGWAEVRYVHWDGVPHKGWCHADYLRFG